MIAADWSNCGLWYHIGIILSNECYFIQKNIEYKNVFLQHFSGIW